MLLIFIFHLVILCSCFAAGFLFYRLFPAPVMPARSPIAFFISGLILLVTICQALILFFPTGQIMQLSVAGCLVILTCFQRTHFRRYINHLQSSIRTISNAGWIWITASWVMVLVIAAGPTMSDDTESYHIQMIEWIRAYGTVPGLANLHSRYGFNSSWFTAVSLFSVRYDHHNFYTTLNSLVSFLFVAYTGIKLSGRNERLRLPAFAVLLIALLNWPVARGNAATAGYDAISTLVVVVLFFETLETRDDPEATIPWIEWLTWPVFLFTIRVINAPMLLLSAASFIFLLKHNRRVLYRLCVFSLVLSLAFLARNVMLSGYLFYPSMGPDLFSFDWKTDAARTERLLDYIRYFNRVSDQFQEISTTAKQGYAAWIPQWWRFMPTMDKILLASGLSGIILSFFRLIRSCNKGDTQQPLNKPVLSGFDKYARIIPLVFAAALLVQTISWFFIAPDPRFIYGPLLCGIAILTFALPQPKKLPAYVTTFLLIAVCLFPVYTLFTRKEPITARLVAPVRLPIPATTSVVVNGIRLQIPDAVNGNWNARCFDTGLPCIYEVYPGLETRGPRIEFGFRSNEKNYPHKPTGL